MELEEYKTIEEKNLFFENGNSRIDFKIEMLFDLIKENYKPNNLFIFRGCNEAKHKMYNSAQRLYISQDLHKQVKPDRISEHYNYFINQLIESCKKWNNGIVKQLFKNSGINKNDTIAYLSYMQHIGIPSPLLDFTFNPYVALFFAIDSITYTPSNIEIDNYFSLYYNYSDSTAFENWKNVFDEKIKNKDVSYETISENNMSIILPNNELYRITNSVNIINQNGLFLYNSHPWYPLERTYIEYVEYMKTSIGNMKFKDLMIHNKISGCYNIHKSLIPAIKEKLNELGITKNYIYPDMNEFKRIVTNDGILNCLS